MQLNYLELYNLNFKKLKKYPVFSTLFSFAGANLKKMANLEVKMLPLS